MSACQCPTCGRSFTTAAAFDQHLDVDYSRTLPVRCLADGEARPPALRENRRTSLVTIGPDTVRLCEPECRNDVLLDLGVPAGGGGWAYRPAGAATVTVAWNGKTYAVSWKRCRPSALPCDLCEHEWRHRIPVLVARAREASEAMRGMAPREFTPFRKSEAAGIPA